MAGLSNGNGLSVGRGLSAGSGLSRGAGLSFPGFSALALSLNFTTGVLDPRITFSRTSQATYYDSTGNLTYAPNNTTQRSEDAFLWTGINTTVETNSTSAPNGTLTADKMIDDAVNSNHARIAGGPAMLSGVRYILSVYAKKIDMRYIQLATQTAVSSTIFANFDLDTGTATSVNGTGSSAGVIDAGNGWWRLYLVMTAPTSASTGIVISFVPSGTATRGQAYVGSGGSVYLWGAQSEAVTYQTAPSTYIATTSAAYYGPRFDYDPRTRIINGLLIEEARTNLCLKSEELQNVSYWTHSNMTPGANATTAPDGQNTACKLIENTANTFHGISQAFLSGIADSTTYTVSFYAKAAERSWVRIMLFDKAGVSNGVYFNLSTGVQGTTIGSVSGFTATNVGNGWYRLAVTASSATGANTPSMRLFLASADNTLTYLGDGTSGVYAWGGQIEAGSLATSYIPTAASSVPRSADVASMTGTSFSNWYNLKEGTFVAEAAPLNIGSTVVPSIYTASDNTNSNRISSRAYTTAALFVQTNGTGDVVLDPGDFAAGVFSKVAAAYATGNYAAVIGGGTPATSSSATVPSTAINRMYIGSGATGSDRFLNGWIKTLSYYNRRLSNAQIKTLTQ